MLHDLIRIPSGGRAPSSPPPATPSGAASAHSCRLLADLVVACTFLLGSLAASGCQSDPGSAPSLFSGEPWVVTAPELKFGSVEDDPDYIFGPVHGLLEGPDGLLYSLHMREASVRRWTTDGRPAGSIGRGGEGPGEFQEPWNMGFFGDSLWVWDWRGRHFSYFDLDGEFLGRVTPRVNIGGPGGSPPRPSGVFRDGTFLGAEPMWSQEIATGELTETAIVHMDSEGETLATIWMRPHEPRDGLALLNEDGSGGSFGSQPFGDAVTYTNVDDGIVVVERRAWTGEGEAVFTLTRVGLTGDTVFSIPVPYTPVPLARERLDSAVLDITDSWYEFMSSREPELARARLETRIREATYKPDFVPPLDLVTTDAGGNLWLRRFDPIESEGGETLAEWWVFDPMGAPLARTLLPIDLRVMHISDEHVWGTVRDELDVDYIVRYRLVKGG